MANNLKDFLNEHAIDVQELSRIKHRVFIVGRFNRAPVSPEQPPKVYLFTRKPGSELSEKYRALFDKIFDLNFRDFVNALQPAVAERINHGRIPSIIQQMPSSHEPGSPIEEGPVVIDTWNYFFWRAAANSEQEAFKDGKDSGQGLLREPDIDNGRSIYRQMRRNLNVLGTFQPRTAQLVEAFSTLLGTAGGFNDIPAYAAGGALPGGFVEKFIDFLYAPDVATDFSLDGLDVSMPVWDDLRTRPRTQNSFRALVNTFRNALIGAGDQHAALTVAGGGTAYQKAKEILAKKKDLTADFARARDAYNALNQIIRSKVLLSMVLNWIFMAHYDVDQVKKLSDDEDKDQMVEKLVLGKVPTREVAAPVKRATAGERDRFKKSLAESFEKLIYAIVADDKDAAAKIAALPAEIRGVATALRADADRRGMLHRMVLGSGDPKPFIESQKIVLIDVLVPVLYQAPTLSLYDLRMLFRREVQTAYLTAVTLDDKYQGVVRQVAEDFLPTFLKNIDEKTRHIKNAEVMQGDLLRMYIERIANKDMAERIVEAQEQIKRAMTVLENTVIKPGEVRGASHIAPLFDEQVGATKRTKPSQRNNEAIGNLAVKTAEEKMSTKEKVQETVSATAAASASMAASGGSPAGKSEPGMGGAERPAADGKTAGGASSGPAPEMGAAAASEPQETSDGIRDDVNAMVTAFLAGSEDKEPRDVLDGLRNKATTDTAISSKTQDAVRALHQIFSLIYQRYAENQDKKKFVGRVERMMLANLMLANQETLGLGKACSNLYAMLLDVVENMDPENPDPRAFIREFSLTRYFDNDVLEKEIDEKNGVTDLRETLRAQTQQSLVNTVSFISELRGIKYLMDLIREDSRAELVVVNATADEFLNWLEQDNLTNERTSRFLMLSGFIRDPNRPTASPGLVYLTDSAFAGTDADTKGAWLQRLNKVQMQKGSLRLVLPPMCLSTTSQDGPWDHDGNKLADIAATVPAPVIIVGPSPFLNRRGDVFGTYMPAGYLFAAHLLCEPAQDIANYGVTATDHGRFRVIGPGVGQMRSSLDRAVWGGARTDSYSFAADFYLYILLTVLATAENNIRPNAKHPRAETFFPFFMGRKLPGPGKDTWKTSVALDPALLGSALCFEIEREPGEGKFKAVSLIPSEGASELKITDIQWFNLALEKAGLPHFEASNPDTGGKK